MFFSKRKTQLAIIFLFSSLVACGESDSPQEQASNSSQPETVVELPANTTVETDIDSSVDSSESVTTIPNGVIYQDEIYKDWPYTDAPLIDRAEQMMDEAAVKADETISDVKEQAQQAVTQLEETAKEKVSDVVANATPQTHTINAQARVFKPDTLYINQGDSVHWVNMNSHNSVSVEGLIPEGAKAWHGDLGENLQVQLDVEGIYGYVCQPHIGFGMVGIIVVGKPDNLEEVIQYAQDNLEGPYRRLIGKLIKVEIPK